MSDPGELRQGVAHDAVVRPLALAADRACSRPSCAAPASATLTFNYGEREAWISRLAESRAPQSYDLCAAHAARTQPPHGWRMRDRRPVDQQGAPDVPVRASYDGPDTVAVLAAALRAVPDLPAPDPPAPAVASVQSGTAAPEPAAPGPAAQHFPSSGDVADEAVVATLEDSTTSPVLEASAADPVADGQRSSGDRAAPPAPRPVLAERTRPMPPSDAASDW